MFLWVAIIFFAVIAALFYFTKEIKIQERGLTESGFPMPLASASESPTQAPPQNNAVRVQEDNGNHSAVRYEHGSFTPAEITVKTETGCFIEINNASDQELIPRLGPYDPKQEKGFLYSPIAAHKNGLIDPRYGSVSQFSFYNKNNPSATFIVHIDPTCF